MILQIAFTGYINQHHWMRHEQTSSINEDTLSKGRKQAWQREGFHMAKDGSIITAVGGVLEQHA